MSLLYYASYRRLLTVLSLMFLFRVLAQLLQRYYPVTFLPPFESWASGILSYAGLLGSQCVILSIQVFILLGLYRQSTVPNKKLGKLQIEFKLQIPTWFRLLYF